MSAGKKFNFRGIYLGLSLCILSLVSSIHGAQIVSELDRSACEEFRLVKELRIYKDPSLFLGTLSQIYSNPAQGWANLMNESPILTTLKGTVHLMRLGNAREFKNFGEVARLYELADPRFKIFPPTKLGDPKKVEASTHPLIIPIKVCGDAYGDSLGFVLVSDLKLAEKEEYEEGSLPPSVYPNPIPKLKK